jgi:uncharacterized protein involved in exopolysaccharide biosynthesis
MWESFALGRSEVHLRDYIAVIRRHDFVVIISFLLIFGTALIVSLYMPRVYESTATIEVEQSSSPTGLSGLMQNVISRGVDQVSMETLCKRFVSNSVLNETIRNIKRNSPGKNNDLTPEFLTPKIIAKTVPDTKMIEVKVRLMKDEGGSERASKIANELVRVMQNQRGKRTDADIIRRQDFINDKIRYFESQITDSDQNIRNFLKDKGGNITWSAYADYLLNRISTLTNMKEGNETSLIAEQKKLNEIKAKLSNVPEFIEYSRTLSQDVLWNKYKTDLAELNLRSIGASFEYGDKSSNVKALLAQTDEINKEMMALAKEKMSVSATTESRNPTYQSLLDGIIDSELRIISYTATRDMADRLLKQANTERDRIFLEMPENQYQVGKMNREVGYKVDIYKDLLTKKIESEIMANENISDGLKIRGGIEIVDPAQPNSRPISPRIKFITLIAGVMGLAVGLSMAFLAEYFEKPIG